LRGSRHQAFFSRIEAEQKIKDASSRSASRSLIPGRSQEYRAVPLGESVAKGEAAGNYRQLLDPVRKEKPSAMLNRSFVGSAATVHASLEQLVEETGVDELVVASAIYDHSARLLFYEILADVVRGIAAS